MEARSKNSDHALDFQHARDADLIALCRLGKVAAFGELIRRYAPKIRVHLRRLGAQLSDADDMAQDAFITAYNRLSDFRFEGPFVAWVKVIATRHYLKAIKAKSRLKSGDDAVPEMDVPQESGGITTGDRIDLDRALAQLKPLERLCVVMNISGGYSHNDMAYELGLPLGSVKTYARRGLEALRGLLNAPLTKVDHRKSSQETLERLSDESGN